MTGDFGIVDFCQPYSSFWVNITLNDTWIDVTPCFQDSILMMAPCAFLLLSSLIYIPYLLKKFDKLSINDQPIKASNRSITTLHLVKLIVTVMLATLYFIQLVASIVECQRRIVPGYFMFTPSVLFLTMLMAAALMRLEKINGISSAGILSLFWLLLVIAGSIKMRTAIFYLIYHQTMMPTAFKFYIFVLTYAGLVLSFVLSLFADYDTVPMQNTNSCPEETASIVSKLTFWWMNGLVIKGYKKVLVQEDLFNLNRCDTSEVVGKRFQSEWKKELKKKTKQRLLDADQEEIVITGKRAMPSLALALARTAGRPFIFAGCLKLINDLLAFLSPQLLRLLINFTIDKDQPTWIGYVYAVSLFIVAAVRALILHQYFHRCFATGMRLKSAVIWAVYRKALVLSNDARQKSTIGEIVNLMSIDAQQFVDLTTYLHSVWCAPIQIAITLYFLYEILGASIITGIVVILLLIPLNGVASAKMRSLQERQMVNKDDRIRLLSEILNGIKVLKLHAWEEAFMKRICSIREKELQILRKYGCLYASLECSWSATGFFIGLATFGTYVLTGQELTANRAFVGLALFSILRFAIGILPVVVASVVQARVSLNRLHNFLTSAELDPDNVQSYMPSNYGRCAVAINDGSFQWNPKDANTILQSINIKFDRGTLTAIVGHVGSGKSSFLTAILGEMMKTNGEVFVEGSIAYVPQQAWILNGTLRNNILFGSNLNQLEYHKVIRASALEADIEVLPGRDQTEIGEKGINLSGGQKQRVSIARAIYAKRDIYLLDDPLSAVDAHVGKHLFNEVIGPHGLLKNTTRILVTHNLRHLPEVDNIVVLQEGKIIEIGTYHELMSKRGAFSDLIITYTNIGNNNDEEASLANNTSCMNRKSKSFSREFSRSDSVNKDAVTSKSQEVESRLIEDEKVETGNVKLNVYGMYIRSFGWKFAILYLILEATDKGCMAGTDAWLALWSSAVNSSRPAIRDYYLGVYGAIGGCLTVAALSSTLVAFLAGVRASKHLHFNLLHNILHLPMSFFDTTPTGRVLNRFSKDIFTIDDTLIATIDSFVSQFYSVLLILIIISASTPYFLIVIVPLAVFYFFVQRFYVATSRQLRRLESISRSPIYSFFTECLQGMSVLRAYTCQERFMAQCNSIVDKNQMAYYPSISANRWLATRLELVGSCVVLFASLFVVLGREILPAGIVGLAVSYALQITDELNWMVRQSTQVETQIVAVERVKEYSDMSKEAPWYRDDYQLDSEWPGNGAITFNKLKVRYREGLEFVLKGISCHINGAEKIGIVGRTGSGKTSLTLSLFRMLEASEGSIIIDGVDISKIGLHTLRSKLSIIPQDPVLFCGTLKTNLDPFGKCSSERLWNALEEVSLKTFVSDLEDGLEHTIAEGGENLSVGQRQLICLARALLFNNRIIVIDEATAAVDMETDDLIQTTIRTHFSDRTILTIAHRLNTIMDCNRIMVIDNGVLVEFDTPSNLLANRDSKFYDLARESNLVLTESL